MTQLTRHPTYLLIEDQLDAIGQKYRGLRIAHGFLVFVTTTAAVSTAAAFAAHLAGQGILARLILAVWITWLVLSAAWWIARPLLLRPKSVEVARLVEERVPNLHNGLTNSVLLARAHDLRESPWLAPIFDEVLATVRDKPLGSAVALRDLRAVALRCGAVLTLILALLAIPAVRIALHQGFRQMLSPAAFVPKVGYINLIDYSPRRITLVTGQPLEIQAIAQDPDGGQPPARLIFENGKLASASLTPTASDDGRLHYAYRIDHVDEPLRWRIEVGGTQGEWCTVNIVKQVKLEDLSLTITPPPYTGKPGAQIALKPDDIARTPLAVLEGSTVKLEAVVDVPAGSALLQLDQEPPVAMAVSQGGRRFGQSITVMRNLELSVLLTEGGQVIARLPESPLRIACTNDEGPRIDMKWPAQDTPVAPDAELKIQAVLRDDHGLTRYRILMSTQADQPLATVHEQVVAPGTATTQMSHILDVPAKLRAHGRSVSVQVEATDNRNLSTIINTHPGSPNSARDAGPQTTAGPIYQITFRDPEEIARQQKEQFDRLRQLLMEMIDRQKQLLVMSGAWLPASKTMPRIHAGQVELRTMMRLTADTFPFDVDDRIIQKTLLVLVNNAAKDAVDLAAAIQAEPVDTEKVRFNRDLQGKQRRIIETLEALLSRLMATAAPTTQPGRPGGDLPLDPEKLRQLEEDIKKFIAEEKRILDATAHLAKKPVDDFDADDKKLLEELKMAQEKLDAFMAEKISDWSKLAEQDMANASLLKELLEVYSEVSMAKDALKKEAVEMAIAIEDNGVELAKEIESNLEKWLWNEADRQKWNQEDPLGKTDIPMAELPTELEDMVGELLEQQEDLFEEMEDTAANWAGSFDKGAGWDAMDGPIANMTAKGVTGNQLPNNNEMNGRSGEGRSGKSAGEFVEETATGKGGRNTPTRLDPTPFAQGQIKDESKDPVGGATGGGKLSGQGGAGLEGPVAPKDLREEMERLATKQAEIRNQAERLNLDKQAARFDQFKLLHAVALMRRIESDLRANRYENAMRRKDVTLDKLETSHMLLSGQVHTQKDTSPKMSDRMEDQINDITTGQLPAAWSEALKEYYRKLSQQ